MRKMLAALLGLALLTGCASGPAANPRDPFEPFNRSVYQFNDAVDGAVLKPVATAYRDGVPSPVRQGVNNFFGNLQDAWSVVNNALQFKGEAAMDSFFRFGVNTLMGLGGILDVATEMNIEKHTKDFGHTLGYWGVGPGPYLVLPLLGPSSLRDTVALPVDMQGDFVAGVSHVPTRSTLTLVRAVDKRADLLKASAMLDEVALDKYTFIRDAYLQRRLSTIFEGNPPSEEDTGDSGAVPREVAQASWEAMPEPALPTQPADQTLSNAGLSGAERVKP